MNRWCLAAVVVAISACGGAHEDAQGGVAETNVAGDGGAPGGGAGASSSNDAGRAASFGELELTTDAAFEREVDELFVPLLPHHPAIAVERIDGKTIAVRYLGEKKRGTPGPPDAKTIFEIGSITKTFNGVLLAKAVREGRMSLDDLPSKYLPNATFPVFEGKPFTLRHLVTHTSGLPRELANAGLSELFEQASCAILRQCDDKSTAADMYDFLKTARLSRAPGAAFAYSNLGASLVGLALAAESKQSWVDMVRTQITDPLQLPDTRYVLDDEQRARMATGFDGKNDVTTGVAPTSWFLPSGALHATLVDLVRYTAANMGLASTPLADSLAAAHTSLIKAPVDGDDSVTAELAYGFMFAKIPGHSVLAHGGATGGFMSDMRFALSERKAMVVLASGYYIELTKAVPLSTKDVTAPLKVGEMTRRMPLPSTPCGQAQSPIRSSCRPVAVSQFRRSGGLRTASRTCSARVPWWAPLWSFPHRPCSS